MATTHLPPSPRFQQCLKEFKNYLGSDMTESFKFTTLDELKRLIHDIQDEQMKSRRMTNLRRIAPFLEAMEQFDKVVQIFLNSADLLAFVWGPVKFLLLSARTYHDAFSALLDAYLDIGENIPLLAQFEQIFNDDSQIHVALEYVYIDIMEFHSSAIKYFKSPVWKQLFHATWKTFRTKFEPTLSNLRRHKSLLETQSNLLYLQEYQLDRQRTQMEFEKIEQQAEQNRRISIANWLSAADSDSDYRAAASTRHETPNSGQWMLQEDLMKRWLDSKYPLQPLLWINGKPGAGKTVLASLIIDECRKTRNGNTMFFFHKYGDAKKNSLTAILRGILAQAVRMRSMLVPYLFEEAAKAGSTFLEDVELAQRLTEVALGAFNSISLILDGLDECPKTAKRPITVFFRSLTDRMNESVPGRFRCCFFSQQDNDIGDLLKGIPSFTIGREQNSADIHSFCHVRAQRIQEELEYPEEKAKQMADKVASRADGMFVFAALVMRYLEEQTTWRCLEEEIEAMPLDLDEVYERIVRRVLYESGLAERLAARMLLGWLLTAVRPLKWHEIQGAIAYDPSNHSFDLQGAKLRKGPKKLCGSLVEIFDDGEIRLVHLSAKLYLERNVINASEEELKLLCRCLDYLRLPAFDENLEENSARGYILEGQYAFMTYALPSWTIHLNRILKDRQLEQAGPFRALTDALGAFYRDHPVVADQFMQDRTMKKALEPLKNEIFFEQLTQAVSLVQDVNFDEMHDKPLANNTGHLVPQISLFRRLIEELASNPMMKSRTQEIHGCKLFRCPVLSCQYFHEGYASAPERDRHANEHTRPYRCGYSGCVAALIGYPTETRLRKHEAEIHSQGADALTFPWQGTPSSSELCQQIEFGNTEAFQWWLEQFDGEIPLNQIWKKNKTQGPLRTAIKMGNIYVLKEILKRSGHRLLSSRKRNNQGNKPCVTKLVREALEVRNADSVEEIVSYAHEVRDTDTYMFFRAALQLRLDSMAIRFLSHQACEMANPKPNKSRADLYLSTAIENSRLEVVQFLISTKGVDAKDMLGGVALHKAARFNKAEIGLFLLRSGNYYKQTKLGNYTDRVISNEVVGQVAYDQGFLEFLEAIFLEATTEREEGDELWILATKLLKASRDGDLHTVKTIISKQGAPINPFNRGLTPLHLSINRKHMAVVDALLETKKADVGREVTYESARQKNGLLADSAIKESVKQGDTALFRRLLEFPNSETDYSDWTVANFRSFVYINGNEEMVAALATKIENSKFDGGNAGFSDVSLDDSE